MFDLSSIQNLVSKCPVGSNYLSSCKSCIIMSSGSNFSAMMNKPNRNRSCFLNFYFFRVCSDDSVGKTMLENCLFMSEKSLKNSSKIWKTYIFMIFSVVINAKIRRHTGTEDKIKIKYDNRNLSFKQLAFQWALTRLCGSSKTFRLFH